MTEKYDLHCHSVASDGVLTPTQVVQRAHERGVTALALTDHDTVDGLEEAAAQAQTLGMRFIPGVEISISWGGQTVHIVGLGIAASNPALHDGMARIRDIRRTRTEAIAAKLAKIGVDDALTAVYEVAGGASAVSRTHFARLLVERGLTRDMKTAFKRYLSRGGKAYVSTQWASLADAVGWIRGAGGVAVVAHPGRYQYTSTAMRGLLAEFKALGGQAVEVMSSSHGREDISRVANWAREYQLYSSVGSDFHGPGNPQAELGTQSKLPEGCKPVWELL